jgi:hypothetical protein
MNFGRSIIGLTFKQKIKRMNKKVKKDIFIGLLLLTGYLIIHRVVSNDIIETEDK